MALSMRCSAISRPPLSQTAALILMLSSCAFASAPRMMRLASSSVRLIDLSPEGLVFSYSEAFQIREAAVSRGSRIWILERARGFEPPTPTLARLCSTPELHPRRLGGVLYDSGGRRLCKPWLLGGWIASSCSMPPPLTPEELFARFDELGIAHRTYSHPAVFTVAEAAALRGTLPGAHCKSLFLKDKKGGFWLAVMLEERRIDLKKLAARLPAPRVTFAGAPDLQWLLGGRRGGVR